MSVSIPPLLLIGPPLLYLTLECKYFCERQKIVKFITRCIKFKQLTSHLPIANDSDIPPSSPFYPLNPLSPEGEREETEGNEMIIKGREREGIHTLNENQCISLWDFTIKTLEKLLHQTDNNENISSLSDILLSSSPSSTSSSSPHISPPASSFSFPSFLSSLLTISPSLPSLFLSHFFTHFHSSRPFITFFSSSSLLNYSQFKQSEKSSQDDFTLLLGGCLDILPSHVSTEEKDNLSSYFTALSHQRTSLNSIYYVDPNSFFGLIIRNILLLIKVSLEFPYGWTEWENLCSEVMGVDNNFRENNKIFYDEMRDGERGIVGWQGEKWEEIIYFYELSQGNTRMAMEEIQKIAFSGQGHSVGSSCSHLLSSYNRYLSSLSLHDYTHSLSSLHSFFESSTPSIPSLPLIILSQLYFFTLHYLSFSPSLSLPLSMHYLSSFLFFSQQYRQGEGYHRGLILLREIIGKMIFGNGRQGGEGRKKGLMLDNKNHKKLKHLYDVLSSALPNASLRLLSSSSSSPSPSILSLHSHSISLHIESILLSLSSQHPSSSPPHTLFPSLHSLLSYNKSDLHSSPLSYHLYKSYYLLHNGGITMYKYHMGRGGLIGESDSHQTNSNAVIPSIFSMYRNIPYIIQHTLLSIYAASPSPSPSLSYTKSINIDYLSPLYDYYQNTLRGNDSLSMYHMILSYRHSLSFSPSSPSPFVFLSHEEHLHPHALSTSSSFLPSSLSSKLLSSSLLSSSALSSSSDHSVVLSLHQYDLTKGNSWLSPYYFQRYGHQYRMMESHSGVNHLFSVLRSVCDSPSLSPLPSPVSLPSLSSSLLPNLNISPQTLRYFYSIRKSLSSSPSSYPILHVISRYLLWYYEEGISKYSLSELFSAILNIAIEELQSPTESESDGGTNTIINGDNDNDDDQSENHHPSFISHWISIMESMNDTLIEKYEREKDAFCQSQKQIGEILSTSYSHQNANSHEWSDADVDADSDGVRDDVSSLRNSIGLDNLLMFYYLFSRLCHQVGEVEKRNECAKRFRMVERRIALQIHRN